MSSEVFYATGRRKTSSARVYLQKGKGSILVNDRNLEEYFGRKVAQMLVKQPLELVQLVEKVDVKVRVKGVSGVEIPPAAAVTIKLTN